jgi:DNA modification methylase
MRRGPSGRTYSHGDMTEIVEERGGSTPFNLIPVANGGSAAEENAHPAKTPYDVAAWWIKYLLPQDGVLLDCFCGSGTMLAAGLDFGASQVIGIEQQKKYLKITEKRILEG